MPNKIPVLFYREYGLRKVNQLFNPNVINITDFPKQSIFHYYSDDESEYNVSHAMPCINYDGVQRVFVQYVTELTSTDGAPRRVSFQLMPVIREYHRNWRKFKRTDNAIITNANPRLLTVVNYSYLNKVYKYPPTKFADINKWYNTTRTIFTTINKACKDSSFDNYVEIEIPKIIPSRTILIRGSQDFTVAIGKILYSSGDKYLLELWKYIDPATRDNSIFSIIDKDNLKKVNLIFKSHTGKTALVNMAYLYSWIEGNDNLTPFKSLITKKSNILQKMLLYFYIVMNTLLSPETDTEQEVTNTQEDDQRAIDRSLDTPDLDDEDNEEVVSTSDSSSVNPQYGAAIYGDPGPIDLSKLDDGIALDDEPFEMSLSEIDKVLEELEKSTNRRIKAIEASGIKEDSGSKIAAEVTPEVTIDPEEVEKEIFTYKDNDQVLNEKIDQALSSGLYTAVDVRKAKAAIEKYKAMQDPYGSKQTIIEAKKIDVEKLAISQERSTIKGISSLVKDPSMDKSSLLHFTEDYAKDFVKKDILNAIDSLQRGGIIIKNYDIERQNTILGSYEVHSVELKPHDGAASTIHFRIPVINKDGTFEHGGNKYQLRTQRVDLPIRKIDPTTVALTSYYGKTFVTLDPRKANSEIEYILKKITEAELTENSRVKKVMPANVYDSDFKAPFIYSVLSANFRMLELKAGTLMLEHYSREELLKNKIALDAVEKNGRILCGVSSNRNPIVVDNENIFYEVTPANVVELGTIYDLIGVDRVSAPVEYAIVKVYSKEVPVGVYLSYFIGFNKLLAYLKVRYRTVDARKQKNLQSDEYAVTFMDKSYIFSRKDRKSSLILGGFTVMNKELRKYSSTDLDTKDPYLSLLSKRGITNMHLKEMENTQDFFIDHITLEILKEMKEPLTFNGLLIRSCELLLTYYHPKPQDLNYMRFRGYERFAGFTYSAIVDAVRSYRSRNISGRAKIDISPFEVWNRIIKDESVKLTEDINPIQNLKEKEIVTYTGSGGRSKETMVMKTRAFHSSDIGVISEANIDSGDAGINSYMAPNPELTSLRGLTKKYSDKDKPKNILAHGTSSILSTSGLLAPMVYKDD